jgi:hypothetical protein
MAEMEEAIGQDGARLTTCIKDSLDCVPAGKESKPNVQGGVCLPLRLDMASTK